MISQDVFLHLVFLLISTINMQNFHSFTIVPQNHNVSPRLFNMSLVFSIQAPYDLYLNLLYIFFPLFLVNNLYVRMFDNKTVD